MRFCFLGSPTTKFHERYVNRRVLAPSLGKKYKITRKSNRLVFIGENVIFRVDGGSLYWSLIGQFRPTSHSKKKLVIGLKKMGIRKN